MRDLYPGKTLKTLLALVITSALVTAMPGCKDSEPSTSANPFELSNYQGRWLVLNYWAEWCAPCLKEIPELNALHQRYADELAVAAVNFDRVEGEALIALARQMNFSVDIVPTDPADQLRLSRPASLPTTYIFDRQGTLAAKLVGPQTVDSILEHTDIDDKN